MREVVAFDRDLARVREFLALPWRLYQDDPRWIPPFRSGAEATAGLPLPLAHLVEERHFLAYRRGEPVARATAYINGQVSVDGGPLGTVGQFEAEDDPAASDALLDEACHWLAGRGVRTVWGPMNGSIWLPYRFMTRGFDDLPFHGEPYNKPYYPALFERAGFHPFKRWVSVFTGTEATRAMAERTRPRHEQILAAGYRFRALDIRRFREDLLLLRKLVSDSFASFPGFHPIPEEAFVALYGGLRAIALPELIQFLLGPGGEVVGYLCMLPDYPRAIRAMRGQTHLLSRLRFLLARGRPAAYVALYLGITAEEQQRRSGAGGALAHLGCHLAHRDGVTLVSALMAEGSYARAWSRGQEAVVHDYALYRKEI